MRTTLFIAAVAIVLALATGSASAVGGCPLDAVAPVAAFHSPASPEAGSQAFFDASASQGGSHTSYNYEPETQTCEVGDSGTDPIASYRWQWGDGTSDTFTTNSTAVHTFASPGVYDVKLTVHAGLAGTDNVTHSVATAWHVTLTEPGVPATWRDNYTRNPIPLAATADGPESIARVEFYVRGVKVGEDTTAPYRIEFDTRSVADGPAQIYARAVGAGSAGNSAVREVKIDNTAPTFTLLSGPVAAKPGHDTFTFRFTDDGFVDGDIVCWAATDDPFKNPPDYQHCVVTDTAETVEGTYTFGLAEGPHQVRFEALDVAGNVTVGSANVLIDGTPPDTSITSATGATFAFASTESGSSFRCRVYADGTSAPDFGACSDAGSHTANGLAPGSYRFDVAAVDAAGNQDPSPATATFTVDAPPPAPPAPPSAAQGGQPSGTTPEASGQGGVPPVSKPTTSKPGKCSKLKGRKRAACVKRSCGKLKRRKAAAQRYRACVKAVTRKR
jgi:PKD repeat protein